MVEWQTVELETLGSNLATDDFFAPCCVRCSWPKHTHLQVDLDPALIYLCLNKRSSSISRRTRFNISQLNLPWHKCKQASKQASKHCPAEPSYQPPFSPAPNLTTSELHDTAAGFKAFTGKICGLFFRFFKVHLFFFRLFLDLKQCLQSYPKPIENWTRSVTSNNQFLIARYGQHNESLLYFIFKIGPDIIT